MRPLLTLAVLGLATPSLAHDPMQWQDSEVQVLLQRNESSGDIGMFTVRFAGPGGPPRHVHDDAAEALFVLEGEAEFLKDGDRIRVKKGEVAYVPKGSEHTFRVLGENGGKLLVIVTPAGFEGFFAASKDLKLPEEMEEMNRISSEYGQTFTGPPLEGE